MTETVILRNITFYVLRKKESHTVLEQNDKSVNDEKLPFLNELSL